MDLDAHGGNKRVFNRLGGGGGGPSTTDAKQKVCFHWRAGRCNRFPCPYLHRELPPPPHQSAANGHTGTKRFNSSTSTFGRSMNNRVIRKTEKLCSYWAQGNCSYGDRCKYLHCWSTGDGFRLVTQLDGHEKVKTFLLFVDFCVHLVGLPYWINFEQAVTGIALPSGSDKLYTASKDETVRVWDCASGQVC